MKKTSKMLAIVVIIMMILQLSLPITVNAANETTINVNLKRDDEDSNQINITATDTSYNIVDLKYVHKDISVDNISYFEENNNDVYTFSITPSQNVKASFELDGYGIYTVYAKNSHGDRYLSKLTVYDPGKVPDLTLIQEGSDPLSLTIQVTSESSIISKLKIAKMNDINENINFDNEGTNIEFAQSNNVNLVYKVSEEGLYAIYAEDENGLNITRRIFISSSSNKTPIDVEITDLENREVNLNITDKICNIKTIKVAKSSEISSFDDFETKGTNISFNSGKEVNINYTLPEDGTYTFFIEDEAGYRRMLNKRIVASDEKPIEVKIVQDEDNPRNITITGTSNLANIVKMKVAIGENINIDYFKDNGENLSINPGREVTANYTVNENCVLNVYVEDEDGYRYMLSAHIIGIDAQQQNEPPEITKLVQNTTNPKQIDVVVSDIDSYIDTIKWAKGSHDASYFESNGTAIGEGSLGKIITTKFTIDSTGTYTVFAKDEEGASIVKEINISSIDEVEEPDTIAPTISGVENNGIYKNSVTPNSTDENLSSVTLTRNGAVISNYKNGDAISEEGKYVLTATDESKNQTNAKFTIDFTAPEVEISKENTDSKNVAVTINLTDNLLGIDILKVASGEQNESYFENGGQQIDIIKDGISASGKINVTKNGIYTAYVRDLAGNSKVQTFEVTTIEDVEEPEPVPEPDTTAPTINLKKEVLQDKTSVNLTINVADTESQIQTVKMANGDKDVTYFENNGTQIDMQKGEKTSTSIVNITKNGTYTIYSEDEANNKTVKTVNVTEIEENKPEPEPSDTTPPTITGVENGRTYKNYVTPQISDENLAKIILTRNGNVIDNYTNGTQIKENGNYILTAIDEAGNKTEVSFVINIKEVEEPDENNTNNTNTNNIGNNTNTNTENNTNTNTGNNTNVNTNTENNVNTNSSTNNVENSVNNNQNNVNIPTENIENNNNNSGSISTNNYNSSNNNIASTKLPYAGIGNVIIIAIIALAIISIFTYIKYRKYRNI